MRWYVLFLACAVAALPTWGQSPSPAADRVVAAQQRVARNPASWEAYNDLAFALGRLGRDTGDLATFEKADAALQKSLSVSPGNYEARKLVISTLLGKHNFRQARQLAVELNRKVPDDIAVWALLADANAAVGDYSEAERDAQWVLDLRRGSTLGFVKAAGLREIFGDFEGAGDFYTEAGKRTARSDLDEQSWLLVQNARQALLLRQVVQSEDFLKQALQLFPDSQLAAEGLAALRTVQGRYAEATELLENRYRRLENPGNLYDWAEAMEHSGQKDRAETAFGEFETKANAVSDAPYNWNEQLIYYYCDHKTDAGRALRLAEREASVRQDWTVLEAHGWALYRNGRFSDAAKEMARVSAIGVKSPEHLCRSAQVERNLRGPEAIQSGGSCQGSYLSERTVQALR